MSKIRFHVVYCSGEDVDYPAQELNTHSPHTKGWLSPRFCDFPQELGFELAESSHISRIQILSHQTRIATKIELYVGDGPTYDQARFERLGYLSLHSNQRSNYQARELKSVYVDCTGRFIRLLAHRCYVNKFNLFNQVGIVAINFIGGAEEGSHSLSPGMKSLASMYNSGGAIKPRPTAMDDISFDMNFDPETARRIREIASAKEEAVRVEDYDTAKRLKAAEAELRGIGGQIAELEVAKRQAVQVEDYDRAKSLKREIELLRQEIDGKLQPYMDLPIRQGLARGGLDNHDEIRVGLTNREEMRLPVQGGGLDGNGENLDPDQSLRPRSREIKPVKSFGESQSGAPGEGEGDEYDQQQQSQTLDDQQQDAPLPGFTGEGTHPLEGVPNYQQLPGPEPLAKSTGAESGEIPTMINYFGDYVVRCLYSKAWILRDAAMVKIRLTVPQLSVAEALPSLVQVLKIGVDDKNPQVFASALLLLDATLEACQTAGIRRPQASPMFESLANLLIGKLGDGQARIRDAALLSLTNIARSQSVGPAVVSSLALRKMTKRQLQAWRPIQARLQLLRKLVKETQLGPGSGLSADSVMNFAKDVNAFVHSSGEVRDAARELTIAVYECVGPRVNRHLEGTLRPKQLEEYQDAFRKTTAGSGSGGDGDEPEDEEVSSSVSLREATRPTSASPPQRSPRPTSGGGTGVGGGGGGGKISSPKSSRRTPRSPPERKLHHQQPPQDESADLEESADFTCQFCGKYDPSFTEDALDLHYFQDCPMLMRCKECGQVIEIICLPEHLLTECEAKDLYEECPRSGMAIKKAERKTWRDGPHYKSKPTGSNASRCPLCYVDIRPDGEEELKSHYIKKCTSNPRRLTAAATRK